MSSGSGRANEDDRQLCSPCRGTGKLRSSKGGEPHEVTCPWCSGSGRFQATHDAQAQPAEGSPQG